MPIFGKSILVNFVSTGFPKINMEPTNHPSIWKGTSSSTKASMEFLGVPAVKIFSGVSSS